MKNITRDDVRTLLAVGALIVSLAFAWSDLKHDASAAIDQATGASKKIEIIDGKLNAIALDVNSLKTTIQGAQNRGEISRRQTFLEFSTPNIAGISATPAPQQVTYNAPTPEPTPLPAPTPTQAPILCVLTICL